MSEAPAGRKATPAFAPAGVRVTAPLPLPLQLSLAGAAFHKKQTLVWKNGYAMPVETAPAAAPSSTSTPAQASNDWQQLLPHHLTTYTAVTANVAVMNRSNPPKDPPKWLEFDKKVWHQARRAESS